MTGQRRLPLGRLPIRHAPMPVLPRKGALYQDDDWQPYIVDSARGSTIKLRAIGDCCVDELEWTRAEWRAAGLELVRARVPEDWCP